MGGNGRGLVPFRRFRGDSRRVHRGIIDLPVVKNEIHAGPLLHHLERGAEDRAAEVRRRVEERAREARGPRGVPGAGRDGAGLDLGVGDDLGKLSLDVLRRGRLATDADERVASLVELSALDEVTRRVRKEEETDGKDDSPCELWRSGGKSVPKLPGEKKEKKARPTWTPMGMRYEPESSRPWV